MLQLHKKNKLAFYCWIIISFFVLLDVLSTIIVLSFVPFTIETNIIANYLYSLLGIKIFYVLFFFNISLFYFIMKSNVSFPKFLLIKFKLKNYIEKANSKFRWFCYNCAIITSFAIFVIQYLYILYNNFSILFRNLL